MSDSRGQPEPSMEEILASIRRIISEESEEGQDQQQSASRPVEADDKTEAQPKPVVAPPKPAVAPVRPAGAGESDVLLLTEMVTDDGSVVSLASRGAASAPPPAAPPPPPAPPEIMPAAGIGGTPAMPLYAPDPEPMASYQAQPMPPRGGDQPRAQPAGWRPEQVEIEPVADELRSPGLASDETAAAAAAAFSTLTRQMSRERSSASGGRLVEDLVREAIEPMLKEWLDANLAALVERIVRQEIQRVVRKSEDFG